MNIVNEQQHFSLTDLPFAYGKPVVQAKIRSSVDDFKVIENLSFAPTGEGEHVFLNICKRSSNTEWLARQLASFANVKPMSVGYAGLKDRNAETTQWFSVHLPGKHELDWHSLEIPDATIFHITRHQRKLQRGSLKSNSFEITLRNLQGNINNLTQRLELIKIQGIPNYFGEQRFGNDAANLTQALALFTGKRGKLDRHKRSLYLSAARSWLFNLVLARRIDLGNWNQAVAGDIMMLNGTHSIFKLEQLESEIITRVTEGDIHPTAPLWGKGDTLSQQEAKVIEESALMSYSLWKAGLENFGLSQERRSLRVLAQELSWQEMDEGSIKLRFSLPAGCYATALLRELVLL